jgi:hypothetical protein
MFRYIAILSAGLLFLGSSNGVVAQVVDVALSEAKARLACGTGTVVASQLLPNGSLQVTCSQNASTTSSTPLQGTGLATPAATGAVFVTIFLVVIAGSGNETNTTTTNGSE